MFPNPRREGACCKWGLLRQRCIRSNRENNVQFISGFCTIVLPKSNPSRSSRSEFSSPFTGHRFAGSSEFFSCNRARSRHRFAHRGAAGAGNCSRTHLGGRNRLIFCRAPSLSVSGDSRHLRGCAAIDEAAAPRSASAGHLRRLRPSIAEYGSYQPFGSSECRARGARTQWPTSPVHLRPFFSHCGQGSGSHVRARGASLG
jgi:hypothetical protein